MIYSTITDTNTPWLKIPTSTGTAACEPVTVFRLTSITEYDPEPCEDEDAVDYALIERRRIEKSRWLERAKLHNVKQPKWGNSRPRR